MSSSQQELFPIHVEDIAVLWVPHTSLEAESWRTSAMLLSQSIKRSWKEIVEGVLTVGYDEDHGNMHTALIAFLNMLEDFQQRSIQLWIDDSFHNAAYKVAARSSDVTLLRRIQQIPKLSQIPQFDGRTLAPSPPLTPMSPNSSPSASNSSRVKLDEWQPSDGSDPVSVQRQTLGSGWIHYDQQVRFRPWEVRMRIPNAKCLSCSRREDCVDRPVDCFFRLGQELWKKPSYACEPCRSRRSRCSLDAHVRQEGLENCAVAWVFASSNTVPLTEGEEERYVWVERTAEEVKEISRMFPGTYYTGEQALGRKRVHDQEPDCGSGYGERWKLDKERTETATGARQ